MVVCTKSLKFDNDRKRAILCISSVKWACGRDQGISEATVKPLATRDTRRSTFSIKFCSIMIDITTVRSSLYYLQVLCTLEIYQWTLMQRAHVVLRSVREKLNETTSDCPNTSTTVTSRVWLPVPNLPISATTGKEQGSWGPPLIEQMILAIGLLASQKNSCLLSVLQFNIRTAGEQTEEAIYVATKQHGGGSHQEGRVPLYIQPSYWSRNWERYREHSWRPTLCTRCTVEPPNKGHFGAYSFVPCREVVPISEV